MSATRNFHPHAEARMAMWLFGARYAAQGGGSMDFWDSLRPHEQALCVTAVNDIIALQHQRVGWSADAAVGSQPAKGRTTR